MKTPKTRPQKGATALATAAVPPATRRIPLSAIEIETGPNDKRLTIPPDVLAELLSIAQDLWWNDSEGWTAFDHEQIALVAHNVAHLLGNIVGDGGGLDTSGVALVEKLTEEIEARTIAALGVNPSYYTVIVREQSSAVQS